MKYASIVPLIGGETIAMENVFGRRPEYLLTFDGFQANESHLLNYYNNEVPYLNLSQGDKHTTQVDVINTVCPCAGLSSLSPSASSTNVMNEWMYKSADYILSQCKPAVFWGENAPRLASKMGKPVVEKLRQKAEKYGYTFSIYKTKSILHGLSQVRDRTFYFFWKGDQIPLFEYIHKPNINIADDIRGAYHSDSDPMSAVLCNESTPSHNPWYRYVLEVLEDGKSHSEFQKTISRTTNPMDYIESHTTYEEVGKWMRKEGYDKHAAKCDRIHVKLQSGGNIMRKTTEIPKDKIGAFVGHMPTCLTHPDEDRYLTVREALHLMRMPDDFILLNYKQSLNHICQNVPVSTAEFPAKMIKKWLSNELDTVSAPFLIQDNKKRSYEVEQTFSTLDEFLCLQ